MAMTLQQAIDFAIAPPVPVPFGVEVAITISMHDDEGTVLVGGAGGLKSMFRPDLPLLNLGGTATIAHGGGTATTGGSGRFTRGPAPGFSTRGLGPADGAGASLGVVTGASTGTVIPIDFSVRKDPGIPWLSFLGMGPSVQIEIETLSAPAPGGTVTGGIQLQVVEDGALLRAVGPSVQNSARRASYTATIFVFPRPG
jgi:hypothetical protein